MSEPDICALCGRPLGRRRERHHVIPKSKGGRAVVDVHPICHRKIHRVFTNTELAKLGSMDALKRAPEITKFIRWLDGKPQDFHAPTR
ncbi:MAG: HNH endonuclease [Pseudomonadota bacterium]